MAREIDTTARVPAPVSLEAFAPLKVTKRTKELVRLGAAMERCTQAEFVNRAVDEFIKAHPDEIEAGLAHAAEVLRGR